MPLACVLLGWMCAASAAEDWSAVDDGRPETGRRHVVLDQLFNIALSVALYDVLR